MHAWWALLHRLPSVCLSVRLWLENNHSLDQKSLVSWTVWLRWFMNIKVKDHIGQGQIRIPNKGGWAHNNVKLLHFNIASPSSSLKTSACFTKIWWIVCGLLWQVTITLCQLYHVYCQINNPDNPLACEVDYYMFNTSTWKLKTNKIKYKTYTWDGPGMPQYIFFSIFQTEDFEPALFEAFTGEINKYCSKSNTTYKRCCGADPPRLVFNLILKHYCKVQYDWYETCLFENTVGRYSFLLKGTFLCFNDLCAQAHLIF